MKIKHLFVLIIFFLTINRIFSQPWAVAKDYTPVLNTYNFFIVFGGEDGTSVKLDDRGLISEMEFIAFPGTVFQVFEIIDFRDRNLKYYRVSSEEYKYKGDFYVDSRMVKVSYSKPDERPKYMPDKSDILSFLKSVNGYPYMWGGNYANGINEMLKLYPPKRKINDETKNNWILKGLDCSGLLYQATNGCTPRNTSSLISYGNPVNIEDKNLDDIAEMLQPLDLIVWNGHVVIVFDEFNTIESSPQYGVHFRNLKERLTEIMSERSPVNEFGKRAWKKKEFVVRRWFE